MILFTPKIIFMRSALFIICFFLFAARANSQEIAGDWEGALEVQGTELPLVFHFKKDSTGKYSATFDSPLQNAFNQPCSDVILKEDSVIVLVKMVEGKYAGKLNEAKNLLTGEWSQSGMAFPLMMKKSGVAAGSSPNRSQLPKLPLPYSPGELKYEQDLRSGDL
jgi:hypothetical protein